MNSDAADGNFRYSRDRPKEYELCYFWKEREAVCSLGEQNCFYIVYDEKEVKNGSDCLCNGCPYGKHGPCIGWCTVKVMNAVLGDRRALRTGPG